MGGASAPSIDTKEAALYLTDLRAAVTLNGGTPATFNRIALLRQLVTAYGGTPTQYTLEGLLREAIVALGGTPTQWAMIPLERELLAALGVPTASYDGRALSAAVAATAAAVPALLGRMDVAPDQERTDLIATTIRDLKLAGIWDKLDCLWMLAAHDEQAARLNWIGDSNTLTEVGVWPTFTVDRGYQSNGTLQLLNTHYAGGDGVAAQDDHHLAVWSLTSAAAPTAEIGNNELSIGCRLAPNLIACRSASSDNVIGTNSDGSGLIAFSRDNGANVQMYRNDALLDTGTLASTPFTDTFPLYICGRNNGGATGSVSTRQLAFASVGGSLTPSEQAAYYSIIGGYMTAVGAA